jgi:radical SAM protein with 4Fe4S-binding SPASM domain
MDCKLADVYSNVGKEVLFAGHKANEHLLEMRPDIKKVAFGINGPDAETHELLGSRKDFEVVLANLRKIRNKKNIEINCIIHGKNWHLLEEMCRLAHDEGVSLLQLIKLRYVGRATNLPKDYFMSKEQIKKFFKKYYQLRKNYKPTQIILRNWGPQFSKTRIAIYKTFGRRFHSNHLCKCESVHVTIKADSKEIYPCLYSVAVPEMKIGHFDSEKGLVFTKGRLEKLQEKIREPCKSCKILNNCHGGCRSEAISEKTRLKGEFDLYAGYENCPVDMRVTNWFQQEGELRSTMSNTHI